MAYQCLLETEKQAHRVITKVTQKFDLLALVLRRPR